MAHDIVRAYPRNFRVRYDDNGQHKLVAMGAVPYDTEIPVGSVVTLAVAWADNVQGSG